MADYDPFKSLEIVLIEGDNRDPALADDMDFDAYRATRDPALIKERPGEKAARYTIVPMSRLYVAQEVDAVLSPAIRNMNGFLGGCHRFVDAAGGAHVAATHVGQGHGQAVATAAWIGEVADITPGGMGACYEIGFVARTLSSLPKNRPPRFV